MRLNRAGRVKDGGSIISSLIEEALFEFVSLGDSGVSQSGAAPLGTNLQFGGPQNWSDANAGFGTESGPPRAGPSSSRLEIGNLAALEDEDIPQSKLLRSMAGRSLAPSSGPPGSSMGRNAVMIAAAAILIVLGIATGFYLARKGTQQKPPPVIINADGP